MKNYSMELHLNNIEQLCKLNKEGKTDLEIGMFDLIDQMADFVQDNTQYSNFDNYNKLTDMLVDVIDYCNSADYKFSGFKNKYDSIMQLLMLITDDIKAGYQTNIYFRGTDKYGLIDTILNSYMKYAGNIKLYKHNRIEVEQGFNVLILSEETSSGDEGYNNFDAVIYYDKFMNDLYMLVERIYHMNPIFYDYHYLVNAINIAKGDTTESIIIGHSYSLNGIDNLKLDENAVNLSLSSQDLYYSYEIVKQVINENKKIKKCYIGTGYWSFYLDLSRAQNAHELARVENIYYPILKDSHNCKQLNMQKEWGLDEFLNPLSKYVFDTKKIYAYLNNLIYKSNKTYFNNKVTREAFSLIGNVKLNLLEDKEKYRLGKERAEQHNKMLRYTHTREENEGIIRRFLKFLNDNSVEAVIVNLPTSRYYNEYLNNQFKVEYYRILNELKKEYRFTLIDLNDNEDLLADEDYRDLDHVGSLGAEKISSLLNQIID